MNAVRGTARSRSVTTDIGPVQINVLRDRDASFEPDDRRLVRLLSVTGERMAAKRYHTVT